MAKVTYASFAAGLSGKSDSIVYFPSRSSRFGYFRKYTTSAPTENQVAMGKKLTNALAQYRAITPEGKQDLSDYAKKFANLPPQNGELRLRANSAFAVFYHFLWNYHKADPTHVDIDSISLTDIATLMDNDLSVYSIVTSGYLPVVPGYDAYIADFVGTP